MRLTDLFKVPTNLDINGPDPDKPYRSSCPDGDWQSNRWVATARTAREQQTQPDRGRLPGWVAAAGGRGRPVHPRRPPPHPAHAVVPGLRTHHLPQTSVNASGAAPKPRDDATHDLAHRNNGKDSR